MTTQLALYNGALRAIKERKLASLSENTEARRVLDDVWNDGAVDYCLEQGYWNFALRTSRFTPNVGFTASFGYRNQFTIPSDFIRLAGLCTDEYFKNPLTEYTEEAGNWYADINPLYVSYVSNDNDYGGNLAMWPESFCNYVELYLADKICGRLTGESDMVEKDLRKALIDARSKDAMNEPAKFMPTGSFIRARAGSLGRRDRGNRGSLIG